MGKARNKNEAAAEKKPSPLPQRLRMLREQAGMTQQALAVAAGLSVTAIAALEQGRKANPRVNTVRAIAKALGVGADDLFLEG